VGRKTIEAKSLSIAYAARALLSTMKPMTGMSTLGTCYNSSLKLDWWQKSSIGVEIALIAAAENAL
jgi:hypothetical protein